MARQGRQTFAPHIWLPDLSPLADEPPTTVVEAYHLDAIRPVSRVNRHAANESLMCTVGDQVVRTQDTMGCYAPDQGNHMRVEFSPNPSAVAHCSEACTHYCACVYGTTDVLCSQALASQWLRKSNFVELTDWPYNTQTVQTTRYKLCLL
jgi:hypothetical protein